MKVFISHSSAERDFVIPLTDALLKRGHYVLDPSEEVRSGRALTSVSTLVHSSDVVIAVLAGQDPKVYYEMGVAAGAGKSVLVVAPSTEELAPDLQKLPYVQTSGNLIHDAQTVAMRLSDFQIVEQERQHAFKSANEALKAAWADSAYLESMSASEFEELLANWLRENDYLVAMGQDVKGEGYDFSMKSKTQDGVVLVQVKKMTRQSRVSVEPIKQLLTAIRMTGATTGLIVSTSQYTSAAAAFAIVNSIALRTVGDLLKAKTEQDLLASGLFNEIMVAKDVRLFEDVIEPCLKRLKDNIGKTNVSIACHGFEKVPLISVDESAIQHVVMTLLENAVLYSPPGATLSLDAVTEREFVEVRFTNPASTRIHPEDIEKLFALGYRGREAYSVTAGSGIGLYVARNLIKAHGGELLARVHDDVFVVIIRIPLSQTR